MSYRYYIIDAFSQQAFGGVPVAVFPRCGGIPESQLPLLSSEMLAVDTVFLGTETPESGYSARVFDGGHEVQAGAHTQLAAIAALLKSGQLALDNGEAQLQLHTLGNLVDVHVDTREALHPIMLNQVVTPQIDPYVPSYAEIAATIGLSESDIASNRYSTLIVNCGKPYLIVPLKSYHAVREASFNQNDWARSSLPQSLVDSILLFAPSTESGAGEFHTRLLEQGAPHGSDPAVGDVMPAFAAFLCQQKQVRKGTHSFTVKRGPNDGRQSHLHLEMDHRGEDSFKLRIGGCAVASTSAEILSAA